MLDISKITLPSGSTYDIKDAAYEAFAPSYTGTPVRLKTGNISVLSSASFSGTQGTITVS